MEIWSVLMKDKKVEIREKCWLHNILNALNATKLYIQEYVPHRPHQRGSAYYPSP